MKLFNVDASSRGFVQPGSSVARAGHQPGDWQYNGVEQLEKFGKFS